MTVRIGVDFGGTKIEAAALDEDGRFLVRERVSTPQDYEKAVRAAAALVDRVEAEAGRPGTVGVGHPGSISPKTDRIRNSNSTWLNDKPFGPDLAAAMGRKVKLANDADCLALSESRDGAGSGAGVVFAVIFGTGCGGGLVVNGALIRGRNGFAGEWGHGPLPWARADEASECWCGRKNCLETFISGTGLQKDFTRATGESWTAEEIVEAARLAPLPVNGGHDASLLRSSPRKRGPSEPTAPREAPTSDAGEQPPALSALGPRFRGDERILDTALALEAHARAALDRWMLRTARGLANVCNLIDPDVIVIGGGLSNVHEFYEQAPALIGAYVFSDTFETPLVPAAWGDSSGVRGAARLWS
ncbi:ROK family protein [Caulobacter sp. 17J65-9]|uniref:ROK family protein n=1 Tax=Caulobacter sp. 17J65-9 TaxID=2709382 RepID=UPI0013CDDA52|nr:ROK family protein [Caulobacter sp. 17J65-9]NEX93874.1 ROK family protein [Caulobacter sp. 17J65-9]